jgi:hypothetical protein
MPTPSPSLINNDVEFRSCGSFCADNDIHIRQESARKKRDLLDEGFIRVVASTGIPVK